MLSILLKIIIIYPLLFTTVSGIDGICDIIAATINTIQNDYAEWACDVSGNPLTSPCSAGWSGISCSGGNIIEIALDSYNR